MALHQAAYPDDALFRLAMASAGIGMAIVSLEGEFLEVNPALCRIFARPAAELVGMRASSLTHPDDLQRSAELHARLLEGELDSVDIEKRYLRADGSIIEVVVNAAVMRGADGAQRYFVSQLRDVTGQRRAERELLELNATLEDRVQARTAELQAANRRLEAFAYGVSHDLRAPLRTIEGFAAQLARQAGAVLGAEGHEHLARIRNASTRMGALIDSLLELGRVERAVLRPVKIDLTLMVEWAAAELQDAHPQREALVSVQPGLEMVGDERLLKSMLTQLLRNAWQFSAVRERVEIQVEGTRSGEALRLVVRDHGIGFDMAYADKLFEPFQRLHGGDQGAGNGIGLTIAQQVAVRHRGGIRAEGRPDAGATFHVELRDLQPTAGGAPHPGTAEAPAA